MSRLPPYFGSPARTLPIVDLRKQYSFLKLPPIALDDDLERERYDFNFRLYWLGSSMGIALIAVTVGVIVLLTSNPQGLCHGWARDLWPWNEGLLQDAPQSGMTPTADCRIVSASSWAVCVWAPWLAFQICWELLRRDRYVQREGSVWLLVLLSMAGWIVATWPLQTWNSFAPNLLDPPVFAAAKKGLVISVAFLMTGSALFFVNTRLFHLRLD